MRISLKYSEETKRQAIARVLTGDRLEQVAGELNINESTLKGWVRRAEVALSAQSDPKAILDRTRLLSLLSSTLTAQLEAARSIAEVCSKPDWIEKQNAADMAIFAGVNVDKLVKLANLHVRLEQPDNLGLPSLTEGE